MSKNKKDIAEEKVVFARMIRDFPLYTAQEVHDLGLDNEEFITEDNKFSLKYVAPYERKGRKDKQSDGSSKPRVKVRGFFRKIISLHDHRELYGVDISLCEAEHRMHQGDSEWYNTWKELVRDFCEIEERFYPGGIKSKKGYKIADAYYAKTNTVIEFQKSFSDEALRKTEFYKNENLHLIWIFYLPTLSVFENNNLYNIREDNFYHFFRIEDFMPDFFEKNIVFVQDKTDKIYLVKNMKRVESTDELEATVRYFDMNLRFNTSLEFVYWLRNDWENSPYYKGNSIKEKVFNIKSYVSNTDIDKVFKLLLKSMKDSNSTLDDLPSHIIIISDMEFDEGVYSKGGTNFDGWKKAFEKEGYKLPKVVFWNAAGNTNGLPVTKNNNDVIMVSGFSTNILENMFNLDEYSPISYMMESLEKYINLINEKDNF